MSEPDNKTKLTVMVAQPDPASFKSAGNTLHTDQSDASSLLAEPKTSKLARRKRFMAVEPSDEGPAVHITPNGRRIDYRKHRLDKLISHFGEEAVEAAFEPIAAGGDVLARRNAQHEKKLVSLAMADGKEGWFKLDVEHQAGDPLFLVSDLVLELAAQRGNKFVRSIAGDIFKAMALLADIEAPYLSEPTAPETDDGSGQGASSNKMTASSARSLASGSEADRRSDFDWFSTEACCMTSIQMLWGHGQRSGNPDIIDLADRLLAHFAIETATQSLATLNPKIQIKLAESGGELSEAEQNRIEANEAATFNKLGGGLLALAIRRVHADRQETIGRLMAKSGNHMFYQEISQIAAVRVHHVAMARLVEALATRSARAILGPSRKHWNMLEHCDPHNFLLEIAEIADRDIHSDIADVVRANMVENGLNFEDIVKDDPSDDLSNDHLPSGDEEAGQKGQPADNGLNNSDVGADDSVATGVATGDADEFEPDPAFIAAVYDSIGTTGVDRRNREDNTAEAGRKASGVTGSKPQIKPDQNGKPSAEADKPHTLPLDPRQFETLDELLSVQAPLVETKRDLAERGLPYRKPVEPVHKNGKASNAKGESASGSDAASKSILSCLDLSAPYRFADNREALMIMALASGQTIGTKEGVRDTAQSFAQLDGVWMPLAQTPDLSLVRGQLLAEFPHLETAITGLLSSMVPHPSIKFQPTLLLGPPGSGKSHLARRLGEVLATAALPGSLISKQPQGHQRSEHVLHPHKRHQSNQPKTARHSLTSTIMDIAGTSDAMLFGTSRKWSNGTSGVPLQTIMSSKIANPLIIMDEIDKAGGSARNGDMRTALLSYLEPSSSAAIFERFLEAPINCGSINWLFTANDIEPVSMPLRNRLRVLICPEPGLEHMPTIANALLKAEYHSRGYTADWATSLTQEECDAIAEHWLSGKKNNPQPQQGTKAPDANAKPTGSIRDLKRYVIGVVEARERVIARA